MKSLVLVLLMFFAVSVVAGEAPQPTTKTAAAQQLKVAQKGIVIPQERVTDFFDDFEAYIAGEHLAEQNPTEWDTWSNAPGGSEDGLVSDAYAYSGVNSTVITQNMDLVRHHNQQTSGHWTITMQVYIPTGQTGYFNTMAEFASGNFNWAMQVYFNPAGAGSVDAGGAGAATFSYAHDTWFPVVVVADLDNDLGHLYIDGAHVHTWQWTLGTFGAGSPLMLDATDFFGAAATDEMYFDDYHVEQYVEPEYDFFDDFDDLIAGMLLVEQGADGWDTWSGGGGGGEDALVTDAYAYSGSNSVVFNFNNDVVHLHDSKTSGSWGISFMTYIPAGGSGYFNNMSGFTPNPFQWAMECYFDAGGNARLLADVQVDFTWAEDTWESVLLIVDLDNDVAQFVWNGEVLHEWQWTQGGANNLQLDATDFFGAASTDEMYVDDYLVEEMAIIVAPDYDFFDDFDDLIAGSLLVEQGADGWDTWSGGGGGGEDALVSDAYAYSGSNSVVFNFNNDVIHLHDSKTSGSWGISFMSYIPAGGSGYFNTMSGFTPNPFQWAMECYFDAGGNGRMLADVQIDFAWMEDSWHHVEVIVNLDVDSAQFVLDGEVMHQWQWTQGGANNLQLDATDFFGAASTDEFYVDDYLVHEDELRPYDPVGIGEGPQLPLEFALEQNYPNPFNPNTTIEYSLKENANVILAIYNILGQEVRTLVNERQVAGTQQIQWDGLDNAGARVASGIYVYQIQAGDFVEARKMILTR